MLCFSSSTIIFVELMSGVYIYAGELNQMMRKNKMKILKEFTLSWSETNI